MTGSTWAVTPGQPPALTNAMEVIRIAPASRMIGLERLRQHHGQQAADDGVDAREDRRADDARHLVDPEHLFEHHRPGVEGKADVDHDGRDDGHDRQPVPAAPAVPLLQKVRQRRDLRPEVERGEEQRQRNQQKRGHPLEVAVGQTVHVAFLGLADQVDRGDVRREQGQADQRPRQRPAGQEIPRAFRRAPAFEAGPDAQTDDRDEIQSDDSEVDAFHRDAAGAQN